MEEYQAVPRQVPREQCATHTKQECRNIVDQIQEQQCTEEQQCTTEAQRTTQQQRTTTQQCTQKQVCHEKQKFKSYFNYLFWK